MKCGLFGRDEELAFLGKILEKASAGQGSAVIISGEPGVGKTALVDSFADLADSAGFKIYRGAAVQEATQPFNILTNAFRELIAEPLFSEQGHVSFSELFAINKAGLLVAKASSEEEGLDPDIFAGMLTAVQNFVRDSFDATGTMAGNLGRLEYGDMKILIENGDLLFVTAVIKNQEHPDMAAALKSIVRELEIKYANILRGWSGNMGDVACIAELLESHIARKFPVRKDLSTVNIGSEITRISETALGALGKACESAPVLMVLEDIHWAAETSLKVIEYTARNSGSIRLVIVATARMGEPGPWNASAKRMLSEGNTRELSLKKFDANGMREILSAKYSPNDFPEEFYSQMFDRSEGNPLFALELAKHLERLEAISMEAGAYRFVRSEETLPATIEDLVSSRTESLHTGALAAVELASCIGRNFSLDILGLGKDSGDLQELMSAGIVTFTGTEGIFCHSLFQNIIYNNITGRWKSIHHRFLGERYEPLYENGQEDVIYELARHFSLTHDAAKAVKYCKRAGEKAESVYALDMALGYYQTAIDRVIQSGSDVDLISQLRERMGDIHQITGRFTEAESCFRQIGESVNVPAIQARMLRKRSEIQSKKGDYDTAQNLLSDAKMLLREINDPEMGRIHTAIANIRKLRGDFSGALDEIAIAEGIFRIYRENITDMVQLEKEKGIVYWRRGEQEYARSSLEKASALAAETDDERMAASIEANLANVLNDLGENIRSIERYESSLARFKKLGDVQAQGVIYNNMGSVASDSGDIDSAVDFYLKSLEIKRRIGDRKGIAYSLNNIGNQLKLKGLFADAQARFSESRKMLEDIGDGVALPIVIKNLGDCERALGNPIAAADFYSERLAFDRASGNTADEGSTLCDLAETNLEMDRITEALDMARKGLELVLASDTKFDIGSARRILGMCLRENGFPDEAQTEFQTSWDIFNSLKMDREIARLQFELAILHEKAGRNSEAVNLLELARQKFSLLGMEYWAGRCAGRLSE
ncbi:MAG: tetratricopeptide repeat protein [Thermoplasmata archaeon]|nr:tetratricopeptide repeat protein [Thermoplasmata archaeon]